MTFPRIGVLLACALALLALVALPAVAEELPRVPDGFVAAVFAQEPLVRNPCAMTFDRQGRLFVSQGPQYRNPTPETPGDRITILIDVDGDGSADTSKTFAEGFNHIQGLAWRGGELWVANSPELTVVRDLDGDDEADEYKLIYGGLGNLEHALHGLNFAPDGRLYMSKGNSRGYLDAKSAELYVAPQAFADLWGMKLPEGERKIPQPIVFKKGEYKKGYHHPEDDWGTEGGILRCDADGTNLEILSRGLRNPWDIAFDENFDWLGTDQDQDDGDRIISPFFGAHFGWGHAWSPHWTGEKHLPTVPISGPAFHGSGTGVVYSMSEAMPAKYRGAFFAADWLNRTIFLYRPQWDGALMRNMNAPEVFAAAPSGRSLGSSSGMVFDPTDIEIGPDGALWVLSWGHSYGATIKDGDQQDEGRVYRIYFDGSPKTKLERKRKEPYDHWAVPELIEDLHHNALPVWRSDAQDELVRRGKQVRQDLEAALVGEPLRPGAATWLAWTLGRLDLSDSTIDELLATRAADGNLTDRVQALRILAFRSRQHGRPLPTVIDDSLADKEPRIRFAAVQSIHSAQQQKSIGGLWNLTARENDRGAFYATWRALAELADKAALREKLSDGRAGVRRAALLALLDQRAVSADEAVNLRLDEDQDVAELASSFVEKVGTNSAPVLSIEPAEVNFSNSLEVRLVVGTAVGLNVRYTLDGTEPSDTSGKYYDQPIKITASTIVHAALFRDRVRVGPVLQQRYVSMKHEAIDRDGGVTGGGLGDSLPIQITDIQPQSGGDYRAVVLRVGSPVYTNRGYLWKEISASLVGCTVIQAANTDDDVASRGERFLSFRLAEDAIVYVAHDRRIQEKPAWLSAFASTTLSLQSDDSVFDLREKWFSAGEIVLGGNTADGQSSQRSQYVVIVAPAPLWPLAKATTLAGSLEHTTTADALRGSRLFFGAAACSKCHRLGDRGNAFAPNLSNLGQRADAKIIVESILDPNAVITEGFQTINVTTVQGKVYSGFLRQESGLALDLVQASGEPISILKADIEERVRVNKSAMPSDLGKFLGPQQVADLAAFILSHKSNAR